MTEDYQIIEQIQQLITELLQTAGFRPRVVYEQSLIKGLVFNISVDTPRLLIGKQGLTLHALENLLFAIVNRKFNQEDKNIHFSIDIDNYRANREYQLKQYVKEIVSKLKYSKDPIALPIMPRHERKFIHNYIQQQFPHLITQSTGQEPNRRIVINI